jgi:putative IMPACT (imprinted ancient) family translation regulator
MGTFNFGHYFSVTMPIYRHFHVEVKAFFFSFPIFSVDTMTHYQTYAYGHEHNTKMNDNDDNDEQEAGESSIERARSDLEIIQSCYPDEIDKNSSSTSDTFPFQFTLQLLDHVSTSITMKLDPGYPVFTGVQIATYQTDKAQYKARLEAVVRAVRKVSLECQEEGIEGCIMCCAIALETWNDYCDSNINSNNNNSDSDETDNESSPSTSAEYDDNNSNKQHSNDEDEDHTTRVYEWISGEPLLDKKSAFQAHLCKVYSERDVKDSLHQLLTSSSKIQRASHNMYAWRITDTTSREDGRIIIKHDNDDNGEDAAGNKLAFLLDMRKDENVLVVVSRWFGGTHLGPKRFAHIVNVSRKLLVEYNSNSNTADSIGGGSGIGIGSNNKNSKNKYKNNHR